MALTESRLTSSPKTPLKSIFSEKTFKPKCLVLHTLCPSSNKTPIHNITFSKMTFTVDRLGSKTYCLLTPTSIKFEISGIFSF